MMGAVAKFLPDGRRLHLQHGPIDLVIDADGIGRQQAFHAAKARFETILQELVDELPLLRRAPGPLIPTGTVAQRMHTAVLPHSKSNFATLMAAVAGGVADEVLAAMCTCPGLDRAYVNNGGDIAIFLTAGNSFNLAMTGLDQSDHGRVKISESDRIGGVATSGQGGRSLSMGIADSVTVLAKSAASADVAATLIANAVDLPKHPAIVRQPANWIDPDSDLGSRLVVTSCDELSSTAVSAALNAGAKFAKKMLSAGLISGVALSLQGKSRVISLPTRQINRKLNHYA